MAALQAFELIDGHGFLLSLKTILPDLLRKFYLLTVMSRFGSFTGGRQGVG
jgi:hypothetical protein